MQLDLLNQVIRLCYDQDIDFVLNALDDPEMWPVLWADFKCLSKQGVPVDQIQVSIKSCMDPVRR